MLREPGSRYEAGRSTTLLKIKTFHDADGVVVEHVAGKGRHKGRMGALVVRMSDGTEFSVGTGFTDKLRENPPAAGSTISFRYQELTDGGVPRFPSFVRLRNDVPAPSAPTVADEPAPARKKTPAKSAKKTTIMKETPMTDARYFEFVDDKSSKFWEIAVAGTDVTVRYGRIGANGQTKTKSFDDETAAQDHADKLIDQKTGKGYEETEPS